MVKKLAWLLAWSWLLAGCALGRGEYGPFEVIVKTENGEHVEDVIVTLSMIGASGERLTSTYDQTIVASTDQVITFPRGYVTRAKAEAFTLDYSVLHPDYLVKENVPFWFSTDNDGTIRFPQVTIESLRDVYARRLARETQRMKDEGMTEIEIDARIRREALVYRERYVLGYAEAGYLAKAARTGRKDLVEKYLRVIEERVIHEEKLDETQARALDEEFRGRIKWMLRK